MHPLSQTATTTTLLEGLKDESASTIWDEFDRRYRTILYGFARRLGLDDTDAADVAQETLLRFVRDYRAGRYNRGAGRLRAWLIGIARYRVADLRRERARHGAARGESAMADVPDDSEAESIWDAEQRQFVFDQALAELRTTTRLSEQTLEAFERVVLRQESVSDVAAALGVTPQEIYDAKSRIVEKLRGVLAKYAALFDAD